MDMINIDMVSDEDEGTLLSDRKRYPWGTSLDIRDEMLEQLNISSLNVGDEVQLHGVVKVVSKSDRSDEDESSKSMTLQFVKLGSNSTHDNDNATKLYE